MNDIAPEPRPAASLILLRDGSEGPEVLMVQRAARGPFPSLHVFPGGKVDQAGDDPAQLQAVCGNFSDGEASARLGVAQGGIRYWIACVRECFEETGILLATRRGGAPLAIDADMRQRLARWRSRLNADEASLLEMCLSEELELSLRALAYTSHWITPKIEKKRFNTRFFVACMPDRQSSEHDGRELVDTQWIPLNKVLAMSEAGAINLILPTISNLNELMDGDTAAEIVANRAQLSEIPTILPKFVKIDGEWTGLLPGDPRYHRYQD